MAQSSSREADILLSLHERVPAFTHRNVFETLALLAGIKPVVRLVLDEAGAGAVHAELRRVGLAAATSEWVLQPAYTNDLRDEYTQIGRPGEDGRHVVAVSRSLTLAREFLGAELANASQTVGDLLGYPSCCVAAYERLSDQHDWVAELLAGTPEADVYPCATNRLAYLFDDRWIGFDYFPCSLQCDGTRRIFAAMRKVLQDCGLGDLANLAFSLMSAPVVICRGVIVQLQGTTVGPGTLAYDLARARLHAWMVEPGADRDPFWDSDSIRLGPDVVEFLRSGRQLGAWKRGDGTNRVLVFA